MDVQKRGQAGGESQLSLMFWKMRDEVVDFCRFDCRPGIGATPVNNLLVIRPPSLAFDEGNLARKIPVEKPSIQAEFWTGSRRTSDPWLASAGCHSFWGMV